MSGNHAYSSSRATNGTRFRAPSGNYALPAEFSARSVNIQESSGHRHSRPNFQASNGSVISTTGNMPYRGVGPVAYSSVTPHSHQVSSASASAASAASHASVSSNRMIHDIPVAKGGSSYDDSGSSADESSGNDGEDNSGDDAPENSNDEEVDDHNHQAHTNQLTKEHTMSHHMNDLLHSEVPSPIQQQQLLQPLPFGTSGSNHTIIVPLPATVSDQHLYRHQSATRKTSSAVGGNTLASMPFASTSSGSARLSEQALGAAGLSQEPDSAPLWMHIRTLSKAVRVLQETCVSNEEAHRSRHSETQQELIALAQQQHHQYHHHQQQQEQAASASDQMSAALVDHIHARMRHFHEVDVLPEMDKLATGHESLRARIEQYHFHNQSERTQQQTILIEIQDMVGQALQRLQEHDSKLAEVKSQCRSMEALLLTMQKQQQQQQQQQQLQSTTPITLSASSSGMRGVPVSLLSLGSSRVTQPIGPSSLTPTLATSSSSRLATLLNQPPLSFSSNIVGNGTRGIHNISTNPISSAATTSTSTSTMTTTTTTTIAANATPSAATQSSSSGISEPAMSTSMLLESTGITAHSARNTHTIGLATETAVHPPISGVHVVPSVLTTLSLNDRQSDSTDHSKLLTVPSVMLSTVSSVSDIAMEVPPATIVINNNNNDNECIVRNSVSNQSTTPSTSPSLSHEELEYTWQDQQVGSISLPTSYSSAVSTTINEID